MWLKRIFHTLLLLSVAVSTSNCGKGNRRSNGRQALKFLKSHRGGIGAHHRRNAASAGLWPSVFNLATKAVIFANATCGQDGREEFCRMAEGGKGRCGVCDDASPDEGKRHPIEFAIDDTNRWWQSPALYYGPEYEFVTITIDLKQVYQIAYVIVKMANSPRPGTWILERSVDGKNFSPWQFFARSDKECFEKFGIEATKGKPQYFTDTEVICTSYYSRLTPLENGEIHTSLIHGRPGANETSPELLEFTKARYVRLSLMGLRGTQEPLPRWLSQDVWKDKRLFYAIRDISVGGQCVCNGHAENCRHNVASGHPECECEHHTCGPNCDRCCPMFNQRKWSPGTARDAGQCLPCNCFGHASSCHYDEDVDRSGLSLDIKGNYQGGGVCNNCTDHTTGINCDKCEPGFFRPEGTLPDAAQPCIRCNCGPADSCIQYGPEAGTCRCRLGFIGDRCEACAPGFRGYPDCEPCPCDARGVAGLEDCEGECLCKTNVEGKYCDRCKPGHFGLRNDVPEGCLSCFCSGVTTLCEPAAFIPRKIQSLKEWQITDLKVSKVVKPNWNGQSVFSLGNYDFPGITSLYWFAPQDYLGNKLEAYNSNFLIKVQWVVMRGDTSGVPTRGPNIVIGGTNGLKIAHGDDSHTSSNTDFHIKLSEPDWFHIPEDIKDITEIDPSIYHGGKVSRSEFLSVLADVKYILLRSTFHTDQIEALLEEATLNLGEEEDIYSSVEKCSCPSGYTGLSCESCSFGYVRIYTNTSLTSTTLPTDAFCAKCDCNGHSPTCNATTGECFCEHNTLGRKCERCSPGFYGNPTRGTPEDCKKCACPLLNDDNNFSPSCQLDYFTEELDAEETYVCTQCPKGYTGDHCEICDDGFYGNPMEIGNNCQLCDCNGGPCDRTTGQCLSCKGNTEGWKCEKCKPEHYGEPSLSNCKACECDPIGSITKQCDNNTGQCHCKEKFTGRTCDKCEIGYGNVTALCTPCSCNSMGSKSEVCDTHTGTCDCQPGVEGFHCDACQNLYYGFSEAGCQPCTCDPDGSKFPMCDVKTGECVCSPHYTGKSCAVCENGYWKQSKTCVECKCNEHGSLRDTYCDKETGQCQCKTGVTGNLCDICLPDHYGNVKIGCKKCDPCDKKGHICDPTNGKCVCPPLTTGSLCERCSPNAWGYEPAIGCKACACSATGSSDLQCDLTKGTCSCQNGFEGEKCDRCSYGYYGYPNCRKCGCDPTGTEEGQCQNGLCRCAEDGTCLCKQNVQGKNCNTCKENKYGLRKGNPQGCTECFCFGRSNQCEDALYHWSKTTRLERNIEESNQVAEDELMLPTTFMGDITSSYGGYLVVEVPGGYFDVFLEGNSVELHSESNNNELQLVESENWRVVSRNTDFPSSCVHRLTRACFMVVLQKVTAFVVKSNNRIKEVLLDKAENEESTYPVTHSIEKCQCPEEYTGLSCQDPNEGFYRYYPRDQQSSWVDVVVGIAKECDCGGHSSECDAETGFCENCDEHTSGNHCETCIEGFYMDKYRNCAPCLCPSANQNNAKSCFPKGDHFKCECKEGYTGNFCEECDERFYRKQNSTSCEPCNCNRFGIVPGDPGNCNQFGRCTCGQGFTGAKCDQCMEERKYIKNGICETCDECTMKLFDVIDLLKHDIEGLFDIFKNGIGPPWKKLTENVEKLKKFSARYYQKKEKLDLLTENADKEDNEAKVTKIKEKLSKNSILAEENLGRTDKIYEKSGRLLEESMELSGKLITLIQSLESFGTKHVNLKEALKRARYTLKEIEGVSKQFTTYQDEALSFCTKVSKTVDNLYKLPPELPEKQLMDLKGRIQDLIDIGTHVENISKIADIKNLENSKGLEKVKEKVEILKSKNKNIEIALGNIMKNNVAIGEAKDNLHIVYGELGKIQDFVEFKEIEDRVKKQMKDIPEIGLLHSRAIEHVQRLDEKINKYNSLFNFTKDEWKKINASGAYEAIVSGVQEAEASVKVSREILNDAIGLIEPEKMDSLGVRTNLAHAYSDRLKQRINNLKNISKNFGDIQNKLVKLKYGILENGKSNNDLTQILHKINNEITSQSERVTSLEEAMKNATVVSEDMRNIEKQLDDMSFDKQFVLTKKYQKYSELTAPEEIAAFLDNLATNRRKLLDLNISPGSSATLENHGGVDSFRSFREKMKTLEEKIKQAKQHIDVIDVAMDLTNCLMSYRLPESQLFQSLSITFKCRNCMLFKWSKSSVEILKLMVQDGRPTLLMEEKEVIIPNSENQERTINLQKVGALLKVQLDEVERSERVEGMTVISTEDDIEIGSLEPPTHESYVSKVFLNENNFGLWNFRTTSGLCKGQKRDIISDYSDRNSFFNGKGYREYGINHSLNPKKMALKFFFNTFDENSTIYVAEHNKSCSFIALFLEHGLVRLAIKHSNGQSVLLPHHHRVNDAKRHVVEVGMTHNNGVQTYSLVLDGQTPIIVSRQVNRRHVFKIKESKHYLGGVPPTFNRLCVPINSTSLLGFLGQTSQKEKLTNETISYGVVKTKHDAIDFSQVWIHQNGHMDINTPMEKINSISFILRPTSSDGLIMKFLKNNNNEDNYISLSELNIVINGLRYDSTSLILNDYNNVELNFAKNKKELTINGKTEDLKGRGRIGVDWIQIGSSNKGFSGGIRDILINNRLLPFNETSVRGFSNVEIGREKPLPKTNIYVKSLTMLKLTNTMQNTERCVELNSYETMNDSVKFGDKFNSYTRIRTNFWRTNYLLQLDFRTVYPNGVIFITSNKKMNYIFLELKEGQLRLNIRGRKKRIKTLPIASQQKLNDGDWHNIRLTKKLKKLSIILDKESKPSRISVGIKPRDEIYFGGVPSNSEYMMLKDLKTRLHPFRGCMKSLKIDNEENIFSKNGKDVIHSNVARCFSNVEEGAYFAGDSYAIYKEDFQVSELLELSFEFRTSEQNGILLSVSNHGDYPALSVELQNGAMVMAVNIGNGVVSNVTNNLDSDFSLCNNRWHNVTALYSTFELTINVDGIRKSWVQSDISSTMDEMEAPLFIGGLPDEAPIGTLKSGTNFKGCIRKLKIENHVMDWSDMKELNNVSLNSCPTDHS